MRGNRRFRLHGVDPGISLFAGPLKIAFVWLQHAFPRPIYRAMTSRSKVGTGNQRLGGQGPEHGHVVRGTSCIGPSAHSTSAHSIGLFGLSTGQKCSRTSKNAQALDESGGLGLWGGQNASESVQAIPKQASLPPLVGFFARRSLSGNPPLSDHRGPFERQRQKTDQPLDSLRFGQVRMFEIVSPRFESRKQRFNLPALLVKRRGLFQINLRSHEDEERVFGFG